jgi:type I restriction enzyme M protein
MNASSLVQKLWNYCNVLRDDGLSYGDYVEQLTFLLFLKMADERLSAPFFEKNSVVPAEFRWSVLRNKDGDELETHYRHTLQELGKMTGVMGTIFRKAQNKIQDPAKLRRLIADLIDKEQWLNLETDVKGDAYEGLLQKNAEDTKSGAGQYFTPRPLINAIVSAIQPRVGETVCDPAAGTGGFLLEAYQYIRNHNKLTASQLAHLNHEALRAIELVDSVARLCCMNMVLHGIGGESDETVPVLVQDALGKKHGEYNVVLSNPPFGKKSSVTVVTDAGDAQRQTLSIHRDDFWATTSNKQLNFVQHIVSILKTNGRAAVVLPDNVLFEGGAGETIRRELLKTCDVHTLLRLPTGIFYAQGVKANVLFFDKRAAQEKAHTEKLWIYDLRTNQHFTLKENPLDNEHLLDFISCYNAANRHDRHETEQFKAFSYSDLIKRDKLNLDIFWLKDELLEASANLPPPHIIAAEIVEDLALALEQFEALEEDVKASA